MGRGDISDEIAKLNEIIKGHEKTIADQNTIIEEYDSSIKNMKQALETSNLVCESLKEKIKKLKVEISVLNERLQSGAAEGEEQLRTNSELQSPNDAIDENRRLKDIIANLQSDVGVTDFINYKELFETEMAKHKTEIEDLQFIIDGNHAEVVTQAETIAELRTEIGRLSEANDGLRSVVFDYRNGQTDFNNTEEMGKLKDEIDRLTKSNIELQSKVFNHLQNADRANPFLPARVGGLYPNIDYNVADLRKYLTMADVVHKSDIDYNRLKEKVLIVQNLESDPNGDYMSEFWYAENIKICLKNASFKLFLDGELHVTKELEATTLFGHLFYCNLTTLELIEQSLSYSEFMKLVSSGTIEILKFSKVYVENKNGGKALEIDEILQGLKKLKEVEFRLTEYADSTKPSMTRETAKKLGKLERFQFLRKFEIYNLPSAFDRHAFGKFMNKHPNVTFSYSNVNAEEELFLSQFQKCKRRIINRLP